MASIKVLLWDKKNKDGLYPIAIRIIKDRKPSYIYLGHYIEKTQWDEENKKVRKSHPNSTRLNNLIQKRLSEASETVLDLEVQKNDTSSQVIKTTITSTSKSSFAEQAKIYTDTLQASGKYNRLSADKPRVEHFKEFIKTVGFGSDISFKDITVPLLTKFRTYLKATRNISERTIVNHLIVMRSIFSQAIAAKVVESKHYPFGRGKILIKFPDSIKVGLSPDEVKQIEEAVLLKDSFEHHSRNLWLFAFYFAGMRVSDVLRLRWSDFQNDRLHYAMGKNAKAGSLKIPEKALKILAEYRADKVNNDDLVFPDLKVLPDLSNTFIVQRRIQHTASRVDKFLRLKVAPVAGIEKKLTMHIARHTFGNISEDRIPLKMLQKLYRHSSITTTIGYQANFIHKDADEALDSVVGF